MTSAAWDALAKILYMAQRTHTRIRLTLDYGRSYDGYVKSIDYDRDRPELHPYVLLYTERFGTYASASFRDITSIGSVSVPIDILNPSKGMTTEQVYYEAPQEVPHMIRDILATSR